MVVQLAYTRISRIQGGRRAGILPAATNDNQLMPNLTLHRNRFVHRCGLGKSARRSAGILPAGTSDHLLTPNLALRRNHFVNRCGLQKSARRSAGTRSLLKESRNRALLHCQSAGKRARPAFTGLFSM